MVLLVIDTQKGITDDRLYEFDKMRANIKELIALARENGKEVIYNVLQKGQMFGRERRS